MKLLIFFVLTLSSQLLYSAFDETILQSPHTDSNEEYLRPTICRTRNNLLWDICAFMNSDKTESEKSFGFMNIGENNTVPESGFGIGRSFEFMFEGFARSDLSLLVWDSPDQYERHGHLKLMMFFPREILPAIKFDEAQSLIIVTLPTQEEVYFNPKTKEIIGGALKESPIQQDDEGNAINPSIKYTGTGVVVEANRLHDYPVGLGIDSKDNLATISKTGHMPCKISAKNLWYTDKKKGGNVLFNKKYVTDKAFDEFLKEKCKFSMY